MPDSETDLPETELDADQLDAAEDAADQFVARSLGGVPLRVQARSLYWQGWTITQICEELGGLAVSTVSSWKIRQGWDEASPLSRCEDSVAARYMMLVRKEKKTGHDFKEIDLLGRQMERIARIGKYKGDGGKPGNEADLNPARSKGGKAAAEANSKTKNLITAAMAEQLREDLKGSLFGHQSDWLSSTHLRTRMILKSRQIGATWYFARERFIVGLETGKNQIFISASRAQANIFRNYIVQWVQKVTGVTLRGDPIVVQREDEDGEALDPFELYFLGTNYRTAQGYHGDVIIDECFWIYGFEELFKVASAMATQKQYTVTLFSTPSTLAHEAYPMWSGDRFNKRRAKDARVRIDISHETLKNGMSGPDGIWRQIVTVFDAVERGFDLVDPDQLQIEYSVDEFDNLFRCVFLDDSQSMFPFAMMRRCMVDSWEVWRDFEPHNPRPYAGEVWLGYDPNASEGATGDDAALVAVAPPSKIGGKFRLLEKQRLKEDFAGQADAIKVMCAKYNVTRIGIDTTGVGKAVHQLVAKFFPMVEAYNYSVQTKTALVLKAKNVITSGRLEFDAGWLDVLQAFMSIHPEITKGGTQVTYVASRAGGVGHADLAWAVMHALFFEPLDITEPPGGGSTVEIF